MKKRILILIIIFPIYLVYGQEPIKLNKKYFLLGTLHDYMGRHYPKNNPTKWNYVMNLHQSKIGEIKRIEEVTGKKFKKRKEKENITNNHEFYDLKSTCVAWRLNSFYDFEKNKGMKDMMGFTFYTGKLKCDKINKSNNSEKLSFIAGLFLTAGEKEGDTCKLSLYNSHWRFECAKRILIELGSEIINTEIVKGLPPTSYFIEFKPSEELKAILENEIDRKYTLANSK